MSARQFDSLSHPTLVTCGCKKRGKSCIGSVARWSSPMNTNKANSSDPALRNLGRLASRSGRTLQGCAFAPRAVDAGDAYGETRGGPSSRGRLRSDDGRRQDRRGRPASERRRADRHAARRHGRAARRGSDRSSLCQQGDGHGSRRQHRPRRRICAATICT